MRTSQSLSIRSHLLLITGSVGLICLLCPLPSPAQVSTSRPSLIPRSLDLRAILSRLNLTLVGHDLNGVSLNGDIMENTEVDLVLKTDALARNGDAVELEIAAGALWGKRIAAMRRISRWIVPEQMSGTRLTAELNSGEPLPLKIDRVYRGRENIQRLIHYYLVSYETDAGWLPLCGRDDNNQPIPAIVLEGRWDYSEGTDTGGAWFPDEDGFTFACTGFVLAKCVEGGYAPWLPQTICPPWDRTCEPGDLRKQHQACTRMLRADYCGNGISHTEENVPIHLYDGLGIRVDALEWDFEAEWDEDGAICIDRTRLSDAPPECAAELVDASCGDLQHFNEGTILMSEL